MRYHCSNMWAAFKPAVKGRVVDQMKLQRLAEATASILPLLSCPLCGSGFSLREGQSLVCELGHCFDLSTKGYINLAPGHDQQADKYDASLFTSRRRILEAAFYAPVLDGLAQLIKAQASDPRPGPFTLLDAGCGEGYYTRRLADTFTHASIFGVDLSRDAITAAAKGSAPSQGSPASADSNAARPQGRVAPHWLIANLGQLPLKDGTVDILLNVLTPADYKEFKRVLAPEGVLIKVVPGEAYLEEIRAAVKNTEYSNERVLEHLQTHAEITDRRSLRYTLPVTREQAQDFLRMTPMTFGLSPEALTDVGFSKITIHLELLCCRLS